MLTYSIRLKTESTVSKTKARKEFTSLITWHRPGECACAFTPDAFVSSQVDHCWRIKHKIPLKYKKKYVLLRVNRVFFKILRNPDELTINLACWDMQQLEFLTLSRMSFKLHTYEVLQPSRDNRGEILCS